MENAQKRIALGKIIGPHGIKGLIKILPYGQDVSLLQSLSPLYTSETGDHTLSVSLKNPQGKYMLARIDGVNDRNDAEALEKFELWVNRDALPETDEGEFYIEDLKGLTAVDENGDKIGTVLGIHNFGAGDLIEIHLDNGEEQLLPFNNDYVGEIGETVEIKNADQWQS